jgi:hypothetical protein
MVSRQVLGVLRGASVRASSAVSSYSGQAVPADREGFRSLQETKTSRERVRPPFGYRGSGPVVRSVMSYWIHRCCNCDKILTATRNVATPGMTNMRSCCESSGLTQIGIEYLFTDMRIGI